MKMCLLTLLPSNLSHTELPKMFTVRQFGTNAIELQDLAWIFFILVRT